MTAERSASNALVGIRDRRELHFFQVRMRAIQAIRNETSGPRRLRAIGFLATRRDGHHRPQEPARKTRPSYDPNRQPPAPPTHHPRRRPLERSADNERSESRSRRRSCCRTRSTGRPDSTTRAAEQYASRLVVPARQRSAPIRWSSHKDHASKALKKLAGPHLPASLRQLETAVKRADAEYARAERQARRRPPDGR